MGFALFLRGVITRPGADDSIRTIHAHCNQSSPLPDPTVHDLASDERAVFEIFRTTTDWRVGQRSTELTAQLSSKAGPSVTVAARVEALHACSAPDVATCAV